MPSVDVPAVVQTNQTGLAQLTAHIRQIVQEADRNVVGGQKATDRIKQQLSGQLADFRVAVCDTNLVVNVNCGDPIYHIRLSVAGGEVFGISVGLTPICYE